MDNETIPARVKARVEELDISPISAAISVGLERGYINDLIISKKKSVRRDKLPLVAKALDCDVAYLTGEQDVPRIARTAGLPFAGICETGAWRTQAARRGLRPAGQFPLSPLPAYPAEWQRWYQCRGDGLAGLGIGDGMSVVACEAKQFRQAHGQLRSRTIVIVKATRDHGEIEISLRQISGDASHPTLEANTGDPAHSFPPLREGDQVEITDVVVAAVRVFVDGFQSAT